jgi:uncharacterized protein YkwD
VTRRLLLQLAAASSSRRPSPHPDSDYAWRIFTGVNQLREERGLAQLEWSDEIARCARQQSGRKVELRFEGHNDPERGSVAQRLRAAGIEWSRCGENIFMEKGWDDPVNFAIVFWWYSAGHQANMLDPNFTHTGVGLAQGADEAWFATQIFTKPMALIPSAACATCKAR